MKKLILLLLLASPLYAQDKKISELTSGSPVQAADMIPIARSGANFRLAGSDFLYTGGPGTGCTTPPYNFSADTNAGMCLGAANNLAVQIAPSGNSTSRINLTTLGMDLDHYDAGGLRTVLNINDNGFLFTADDVAFLTLTSSAISPAIPFLGSASFGVLASYDQITISPTTKGAAPKTGTITSADLTDDRTWTFSDASGTVVLGTATDDTVLVGNGSTWAAGTLPNGLVSYNTSTNAFSLGTAVTDPGSNGILSRTALNTVVAREIVSADGSIIVSNGSGVSGNPDLSVDNAVYERFSAGTATPSANCVAGSQVYAETDRNHLWFCSSTNTWTDIGPVDVSALVDFTSGTATPSAACTAGKSVYAETDRNALWACTSTNTWTDLTTDTTGYATIQDEDGGLTQRTTLNFEGAGVTCADDTSKTTCTIPGGGSGTWTHVMKTSDQSKTSDNTLAADNTLTFSASASTNYVAKWVIYWASADCQNGCIQWDIDGPASPTLVQWHSTFWSEEQSRADHSREAFGSAVQISASNPVGAGYIELTLLLKNGSNAGTVSFRWAQYGSDSDATTVRLGSHLEYRSVP